MSSTKKPSPKKSSNPRSPLLSAFVIMVCIALVAVTVIIRIRTLATSLERDEGEYAYAGQLMLEGVPPYTLAYNMKMPGIYAAYAAVLACFGQTQSGIHFGVLVINFATILLLFFLAKRFLGLTGGTACASFFALAVLSKNVQATANAENFVVLPAIAGILLLINFTDTKKYLSLTAGGLLLGIAFMMKQHGAGFVLFGFLFLLWNQIRQKPLRWKNLVSVIMIYSFFAVLPFLITCLILWHCGVFEKFWFWTFAYAHQYISTRPAKMAFGSLKNSLIKITPSMRFIWWSAVLGFFSILWNKEIRKHGVFLIGFLICSFLAISPGFYFRTHYFVLFFPALCIFAAAGVIAIHDLLALGIKSTAQTTIISVLIILAIWHTSFYSQKKYLLESDPIKVSRADFGAASPFPEALEIANYIKSHSNKDDEIAILGSEPQIYFYAHRRSATAYIYTYPLMEKQPYAADMQREMISQIEANKPRFFIFVNCFYSLGYQRNDSERLIFDWAGKYISSHYRQIGLVEILSSDRTLYRWNSDAMPSRNDGWLMIAERID